MTRSNAQLHKARHEVRNIIHAFHKAQDKLEEVQVRKFSNVKKTLMPLLGREW